jgi:RNA polymerase sigma factor (sigma-70 family)
MSVTKRVEEDVCGPVECAPVHEVEPPVAPKGWQGYSLQRLTPLLADAQAGQWQAREEIFFFLHARFLTLAKLRLVGEDAEDVVQETLIVVERHFLEFQTVEDLLAFTDGVMRNKIGGFYRKRDRRNQYHVDWEEATAIEPSYYMDGQIEAAELVRIIWEAIDHLGRMSETCRTLLMGFSEGLSLKELGDWLHLPRGRIDERLFRCRKALRKFLYEQYGLRV